MKKYLLLMLLTPFAYADVVMLSFNIDDAKTTEYQILCVFSTSDSDMGYQYLKTSKVIFDKNVIAANKVYLADHPPVITQMFQLQQLGSKDWKSAPIRCSRPE